jgi:hypothetical protein
VTDGTADFDSAGRSFDSSARCLNIEMGIYGNELPKDAIRHVEARRCNGRDAISPNDWSEPLRSTGEELPTQAAVDRIQGVDLA